MPNSTIKPNILLICADQWRADCISALGPSQCEDAEPRRAGADGVLFRNHFGQCTPCGPSRTSLLTGLYLMNHRSGRNGTPLDERHTNIALEARKARLRSGAVRLHRHHARSARPASERSGAHRL